MSLITAYVGNYTAIGDEPILNIASFVVIAGGIIGGALIEYFSALLTDNTIEAARGMADEGDKLLSIPGVLEGKVQARLQQAASTWLPSQALQQDAGCPPCWRC